MDQIDRISDVVYVAMCDIVGTPTLVAIRREVPDIAEIIRTPTEESMGERIRLGGSRREGFGSVASDVDCMRWRTDHHVICELNHANKYHSEKCTLILMECSKESPGHTMLQLLTPTNNDSVRQSCIRICDGLYISSALYRENTMALFRHNSTQHGPCASGKDGETEYDIAHCFACKQWPSIATSFTLRCQSKRWPPNHVLGDIITLGCHVVPIGLKGSPKEDFEWRISFSLAEQKLIHCMNHTQFMCYGLLKVFLKEVLTVEDTSGKPLLCSYFMKTILFWVIQNNTVKDWSPSSLLSGFWSCFKFLLSCVCHGYLQNFFITENNLFISKVFGHPQQLLYERLLEMYNLGIACLSHCHSIRDMLTRAICKRQYVLSTTESDIIPEINIDCELFDELDSNDILAMPFSNAGHCFTTLRSTVKYLHAPNLNARQRATLRKYISTILRCTVFHLYKSSNNINNKSRLRIINACLKMLKISAKMGFISDKIYFALLLHSVGNNMNAIKYLGTIKEMIIQPYIVYDRIVHINCYNEEMGGLPLIERMRKAVAVDIDLRMIMIKELEFEFSLAARNFIDVPPYVMILMLLVLCYRGNLQKQQEALDELYSLLHSDEGRHIKTILRGISWQILGICQEICGDYQGALLSYQNSLKEEQHHNLQEATYLRIQDVQCRQAIG
ncbi:uncharacterized protein LOC133202600 [Saccostrea echinata]|uniref:uncharacterized protein LOC133202600 n=1 Tax=Saccostrea echinata TaxID=191078 RepID=UPI002A8260BB|nr:uncharacterized protein LOC133202600 [Saccostrea echinata]